MARDSEQGWSGKADNSGTNKKMTLNEYDVVVTTEELRADVPAGTRGTVVMVHDYKNQVFEVEFVDSDMNSIGVVTVTGKNLEKLTKF